MYELYIKTRETDRVLYYKEEWLEEFLDSKGAFYNANERDNNDEFGFCQYLLQNSFFNSPT